MASKPEIAIVGPGRLGQSLAIELRRAGYRVGEIISRQTRVSQRRAGEVARLADSRAASTKSARLKAKLIWFCVPDREIAKVAYQLAEKTQWKGKIAFHSSGALASDELDVLRQRGAAVASVHPLMTFVSPSLPALKGVPFGVEGDGKAVSMARRMVRDLGGEVFSIRKQDKIPYHAWGAFTSPLLIAMLVTAEQVASLAGFSATDARKKAMPILRQTLENYAQLGPAGAFSGPIVRGDAEIVRAHLRVLQKVPQARQVYLSLARAAVAGLPMRSRSRLGKILGSS
jgi:predicted short-subunit dehydrogenase-like oxidoreductase (DUF2520 family)